MTKCISSIKNSLAYLKAHKKELFWYWIGYQCIKGTITTSFIWIPLIYAWMH